jgi:hypothetical protein
MHSGHLVFLFFQTRIRFNHLLKHAVPMPQGAVNVDGMEEVVVNSKEVRQHADAIFILSDANAPSVLSNPRITSQ